MNKNLLKHKLLLLIFLIFCGNKNLSAQCFQIESILVDAFNSASSAEGLNEMVRFKVGPAAINTSNMSVVWASAGNPWLGLIQNATATAKIATINASILANGGCGQLIQPVGGVLPANANVLLITSYNFDPSLNIFGAITQNIYVLFQNNPDTTAGNFGNYSATPGLRTLIINFGSCADSVTYERSLLVNQLGSPGAEDGATVNFTAAGAPTYVNNGNTAPVVTFIVDAGPATIGVCAGDVIPLNGTAQGQQSLQWSAATGSFSNGASISTNYNVPMTATGNIVVRLTATNTCGGSKFDEITLNVTPQITPTFTQLAPICTGSNPPTLPTTSNNGITGFWTPTMSSTIARTYTFTPGPGQCATSQSMTTTLNNNCTFGDFASAVFLGNCTNANTFYNNTGSGVDRINATGLSLNNNNLGVYRQNSTSLTLKGAELKSFKNAGTNVCGVNLRYRFYLQTATPPVFQSIAMPFFDPCNTSTGFFNSGGPCTATDQKWQNLAENISLTNLPLGNYFLEVFYEIQGSNTSTTLCNDVVLVNNNGANFKARFTIAPQPTITSVLGANCGNNGSIVVNNLIPDTAYTYTMTQQTSSNPSNFGTGVTNNAGQFIINNLAPDIYSNITFQANGCSFVVNATATVGGTTKPSTPTFTKVDQNCNVAGTITINSPVGTNITYSTDNGANWQTSPLTRPAGTYNLIARNAANCISDAVEVVIDFVNPAPAAPVVVVTNGSCANALGSFTIQSPLGTNLEYSINGSTYQSAPVFTNVAVGSYNITARNATNCVSVPTVASITSTTTTLQPPVVTATQPTCAVSTGSILVNSPTGSQIIYSIDGTNFQSSNSFLNLSPSTFSVVYKDASGCTSPATSVAIQASTNTLTAPVLGVTNPNCANQTGQIVVQSPVGAQYVYSRDGVVFQNSNVFLNLAVGTYNFTYRDNAQCVSPPTAATLVAQSAVATPTFSKTDANCGQNGSITILSPLGNNFEYSIDNINYQPATVFSNLTAATYQISVRNVV